MASVLESTEIRPRVPDAQRLILSADWETYRQISDALSERHVRLSFDGHFLEFMTISPLHAHLSRLLGRLIIVLTEEFGLPVRSFGDMTCDREDLEKGLESDECFYITNEPLIRERYDVDLARDPPPDLAVEIEVRQTAESRMSIYRALMVPEVWRYDGKALRIFRFSPEGTYVEFSSSKYFPQISIAELAHFLQQRTETDENSLIRSFREWVRKR